VAHGFNIDDLDEVIHGRLRLAIMAYLASAEAADFNELKAELKMTQGNLSMHLRKLEDAGYVTAEKRFLNRKSNTRVRFTPKGRAAFSAYLDTLSQLVARTPKP
jgi:DNA-binding MarR family transcriptional regulator